MRERTGDVGVEDGTGGQEVRVVWLWAVTAGPVWDLCFGVLSADEQARVARMRTGGARDEFVTGRAALRGLLGARLGVAAGAVEIAVGIHGRPSVDGASFSVTHDRGLIGLAMCESSEIGLDVEWMDRSIEVMEIAEAHFAAGEIAALRRASDPVRLFYAIWTRKEAALKALGLGLGVGLNGFDVLAGQTVEVSGRDVSLCSLPIAEMTGAAAWIAHLAVAGRRLPPTRVEMLDGRGLNRLLRRE